MMHDHEPDQEYNTDVLTARRDLLRRELNELEALLKKQQMRRKRLVEEVASVERLIDDVELRSRLELEGKLKPSGKNLNALRAWAAMLKAYDLAKGRSHLSTHDLRLAVQRYALPDLRDGTFRSYLHRFKKDGRLESAGFGRWRLKRREEVPTIDI